MSVPVPVPVLSLAIALVVAFAAALMHAPAHAQSAPRPPQDAPATTTAPPDTSAVEAISTTPQNTIGPRESAPEVTAFNIEVRAPDNARELLERHLELNRYRAVTDLDEAELDRLMKLAERDARNLLGTLGYFSPLIEIRREGAFGSAGTAAATRPTVVVVVTPGEATRVANAEMSFSGAIETSTEPGSMAQRAEIARLWPLPAGRNFTQDAWDNAKTQSVRRLTEKRYPAGRIASSQAQVDADNNSARLEARLDSGPLFRLGEMKVTGIERYDPLIVPRLARLAPGSEYDQAELVNAQQRLAESGYFDSAYIYVDPESEPSAAPVQVQVREAALKKVILGVGLTTDSGPRASIEHTHNRVPGIGWRVTNKLQLDRKSPHAQSD